MVADLDLSIILEFGLDLNLFFYNNGFGYGLIPNYFRDFLFQMLKLIAFVIYS